MPTGKKKSAPAKKAALAEPKKAATPKPWVRISKGGLNTKADAREVDERLVQTMLSERIEAKAKKDYQKSDKIALELQSLGICYLDDKREWYTKVLAEKKVKAAEAPSTNKRKLDPESETAALAAEDDDAPTSEDDDSEDEREDDAFVEKMQSKLLQGKVAKKSVSSRAASDSTETSRRNEGDTTHAKSKKQKKTKNATGSS